MTSNAKWLFAILAIALTVSAALLGGVGTYAVVKGRDTNRQLCESNSQNRKIIRDILIYIERRRIATAKSDREIESIREEFAPLLAFVTPIQCDGAQVKPPEIGG